jgi:hypothetical protein
MKNKRSVVYAAGMLLALCSFAFVHHGWSNYDQTKTLNFTGEILESSYENPHGMIKLKVDKKEWNVVLAPPARMEGRGLTNDMLKVGTKATVVGYPHLKDKSEMRAERITIGAKTTELR